MVEKGVLAVTVQLDCTIVCERQGHVRACRESARGHNFAVDSLRARLEEMRSQGAKDDAPAILLKMDVAKKAAAVRMTLRLFPDLGVSDLARQRLLRGVREWCEEAHAFAID